MSGNNLPSDKCGSLNLALATITTDVESKALRNLMRKVFFKHKSYNTLWDKNENFVHLGFSSFKKIIISNEPSNQKSQNSYVYHTELILVTII